MRIQLPELPYEYVLPVFLCLWGLSFVRLVNLHMYVWQLKEYRLDRFRDYLSTKKGKAYLLNNLVILKFIIFASIPVLYVMELFSEYFLYIIGGLLLFQGAHTVRNIVKSSILRPVYTKKATILVLCTFLVEAALLAYSASPQMFFYIELLRPAIIALLIFLFTPVTWLGKRWVMHRAKKVLADHKHMEIIGITGSYGKTTTKEFLTAILSKKFKVLSTPQRVNTDIGVAQTILRELGKKKKRYEVFVVEMGAYKRGEIKSTCDLVEPRIGILTGVNEQHLTLFGSIENTYKAKFELLQSLPADRGFAIFNGDIHYPSEQLTSIESKKAVYSYDCEFADAYAHDIQIGKKSMSFIAHVHGEDIPMEMNVPGKHNISNVLACVLAAKKLGMKSKDMMEAVGELQPHKGNLSVKEGIKGALIIDDSYNANSDGFMEALDVFDRIEGNRKVLITMGIMELGKLSHSVHKKIGKRVGEIADDVILLTPDIEEAMKEGIHEARMYKTHLKVITSYSKLRAFVMNNIFEGDVVLVENRLPGNLIELLTQDNAG